MVFECLILNVNLNKHCNLVDVFIAPLYRIFLAQSVPSPERIHIFEIETLTCVFSENFLSKVLYFIKYFFISKEL